MKHIEYLIIKWNSWIHVEIHTCAFVLKDTTIIIITNYSLIALIYHCWDKSCYWKCYIVFFFLRWGGFKIISYQPIFNSILVLFHYSVCNAQERLRILKHFYKSQYNNIIMNLKKVYVDNKQADRKT